MEIGESVAVVMAAQKQGKCAICNKDHNDAKKEKITKTAGKTGWKRVTMSKKFEQIAPKLAIYPGSSFPPSYTHEGHHCLALSSFIANESSSNPTDVYLRLNYYLDTIGYSPNRHENSIGLPGRPQFDAFWQTLDANRPLQMHIGDHDDSFMAETAALLAYLIVLMTIPDYCKEVTQDDWEKDLEQLIGHAENYAFIELASNSAPWRLHPVDHTIALDVYFMPKTRTETFNRKSGKITLTGHGHRKREIKWPKPKLDTGPFG
jgi:hypothetical protein